MATIDQVIDIIPDAGHRGVDARTLFVTKQEAFQDALTDVFVPQINTFKTEANLLASEVNTLRDGTLALRNETENIRTLANTQTQAQVALATTQAGIATTKASEANTSANQALTYKNQLQGYVIPAGTSYSVDQINTQNVAMTKAQFNALAEERKANRAGSGFDEYGKHINNASYPSVNEGIWTNASYVNMFMIGRKTSTAGVSKTTFAISNINGCIQKLSDTNSDIANRELQISLPTAPNIYPHDTVLTAEQIASGVIKHADSSNSGLIVNGKFDTDTSGWTANGTLIVENGRAKHTVTSTAQFFQGFATIIGKKYTLEFSSEGQCTPYISTNSSSTGSILNIGFKDRTGTRESYEFTATTAITYFVMYSTINEPTYHDNIAVYPADAISRSDLVLLESWHEDISEKNFVYPLGNTQYLGSNTDGLTGIANGSFTGFETYSLFGNWQTPSALIGKGYVWSSLTEAQKKAFIANPENNCYLDGDKVIQVRYRVRVIMGEDTNSMAKATVQGKAVVPSTVLFTVPVTTVDAGLYSNTSVTYTYIGTSTNAISIANVGRRNQGMYHPTYNPNGTKKASDDNFWYNTAVSFTSISDCFDQAKLLTASGYIGSVSGRPDGLFYDQVHEGDITDLRNSSKKPEDYNRLISREFNKLVAGTNRGKEGEYRYLKAINTAGSGTKNNINILKTSIQNGIDIVNFNAIGGVEHNGQYAKVMYIVNGSTEILLILDRNISVINGADVYFSGTTTRIKSNTLLHCDIIGNPTNYPASWKQSGVSGTPLIVAEDGTSLLPDGAKDTFKLSRKANATPLLCLRSTDNGITWTSFAPTFSTTTNAITLTDEPAANLVLVYYQTHTSMAVPVVKSEIIEYGDVLSLNTFSTGSGSYLLNTLISKVSTVASGGVVTTFSKFKNISFDNSRIQDNTVYYNPPIHESANLLASSSPAVKVFPYLTRTNGKAYLNLVFKEMKYGSYLAPTVVTAASTTYTTNMLYKINIAGCALDGKVIKWIDNTYTGVLDWSLYDVNISGKIYKISDGSIHVNSKLYDGDSWGDDAKFNIVDNVSTTTDDNGQTVLIGQKTVELPYFIGADE